MERGRRLTRARQHRLEAELDRICRFIGFDSVRFADGHLKSDAATRAGFTVAVGAPLMVRLPRPPGPTLPNPPSLA
jgi:hypothetical protein